MKEKGRREQREGAAFAERTSDIKGKRGKDQGKKQKKGGKKRRENRWISKPGRKGKEKKAKLPKSAQKGPQKENPQLNQIHPHGQPKPTFQEHKGDGVLAIQKKG